MHFDDLRLNRVILELRYDKGYLYWDKCGAMLLDIERKSPDWKWERISTEAAELRNHKRNMELSFNYKSIRFIQNEVENLNQFKEAAGEITPLIVKSLEISKFDRVGNRYLYVLPLDDPAQGKKIIQKSPLIEIAEERLVMFGRKAVKGAFVLHLENEKLHYRIELVGIERLELAKNININERFNPKYALRADIDIATATEVDSSDFDCGGFIQSNKKFLENNLIKLI